MYKFHTTSFRFWLFDEW